MSFYCNILLSFYLNIVRKNVLCDMGLGVSCIIWMAPKNEFVCVCLNLCERARESYADVTFSIYFRTFKV